MYTESEPSINRRSIIGEGLNVRKCINSGLNALSSAGNIDVPIDDLFGSWLSLEIEVLEYAKVAPSPTGAIRSSKRMTMIA